MKRTSLFVLAAILFIFSGLMSCKTLTPQEKVKKSAVEDLQTKPIKEARNEEKKLQKLGWGVQPGSIPMGKLLEKAWIKQLEEREDGSLRYIYADGNGVAESQGAAEMQAMTLAQLQLASQIATSVASLINTNIANSQSSTVDANTVTEVVQSAKSIISQKLGRIDPFFKIIRTHETHKELKAGMIEEQVRIFYDKEQAEIKAKEVIKDQLREKTKATEEELKKLMGM